MKKRFFIVFLLLIAIGFAGFNYFNSSKLYISDIELINIYTADNQIITSFAPSDQVAIHSIYKMLNSAVKGKAFESNEPHHKIEIITNKKNKKNKENFLVHIDLNQNIVHFIDSKHKARVVQMADALNYGLLEGLELIYPTFTPPKLNLINPNDNIELFASGYDWNYLKLDGNYYNNQRNIDLSTKEITPLPLTPEVNLQIDFSKVPTNFSVEVFKGNLFIDSLEVENNTFKPLLKRGPYTYRITANYLEASNNEFYGTSEYLFSAEMDLPVEVTIQNTTVPIGGMFVIAIKNIDDQSTPIIEQDIVQDITLHNYKDDWIAIVPLDYWVKAGSYPIKIYIESEAGKTLVYEDSLFVRDRGFSKQHLTIDREIEASTRNDAANAEMAKYYRPSRQISEPIQLWEGSFITPLDGRITTEYGMMRYVNGALTSYRHSGIDIAAPKGTPIKASNRGKVTLSMNLMMSGETIVIDHGLGIFTVYMHLDRRDVVKGDMVENGEIIGTVGSTGFSTGPHLHWTASYFTTNLDPDILLKWNGLD